MKSVKVMSIIGIVGFVLAFLCGAAYSDTDPNSAVGWGFIGDWYGFAFSIVALVVANRMLREHK